MFEIVSEKNSIVIFLIGNWDKYHVNIVLKSNFYKKFKNKKITIDLSKIKEFDSAGVIAFIKIYEYLKKNNSVKVVNFTSKQKRLYALLKNSINYKIEEKNSNIFEEIGLNVVNFFREIKFFFNFIGELFINFLIIFKNPKNFRYKEIIYHIYHSGVTAFIIVSITAFLVGLVVAYQSGVQLEKFGASIFIVDTIGISVTRELGPMITAIVIAGRSASSYTAEIGAMKLTQEIDAMKSFGFNPFIFLVIPRIIALIIALPLLIFIADIIGMFGGAVVAKINFGISYELFINRLYESLDIKHYILGLIKAPFFAFIIATIGAFRGFEVKNNTQSLGLKTTQSVVNAIFLVIAIDALFSVVYTELGL